MTSSSKKLVSARGPVRYDLVGMPDTDFEHLCHRLIRLEYPRVEKPAESSDGGVDALLPKPGGGYARGWQSKHYPKRIHWDQCAKSYAAARENFAPERYTFCFPRNLTKTEQKTFDQRFRGEDAEIPVDYWSGDEIQARLTESKQGRVIARHFFKDDGEILEEIKRAAEAKGSLDTPGDALQRMRPIGEYLGVSDAYFTYAGSTYGEGAETKPPDGAVMSVSESGEGITSRIDVVPKDTEAMELHGPKGTLHLPVEAYREAEQALARGKDFTFEGIEVTWEQLPPAFSHELGQTRRADVTVGPAGAARPPAPWDARITVENRNARAQIDVDLSAVPPPSDWDGALVGIVAGLTVRLRMRRHGVGGQGELNYSYALSQDPARRQLEVLRFIDLAEAPGGSLRIADRRRSGREITFETGAAEDSNRLQALSAFLGWIVEIEDWTGSRLPVAPEHFTRENFSALAQIAAAIKQGGFDVRLEEMEFIADPNARADNLDRPGPIVIRRDLTVDLLGKRIHLGHSQLVLEGYAIEEIGLNADGQRRMRVRPQGEKAPTLREWIAKPKRAKRPPPSPKRRSSKRRGRSRRRGGR